MSQEVLSQAEESFERIRKQTGLILAPVVFCAIWLLPIASLSDKAHALFAVLGLVVTLWVTEAIPLAATSLLGTALCIVLGIAPAREVLRGFADPVIFLFLGSFLLAEAMLKHGLNRRVAFQLLGLRWVGESPFALLLVFGVITGGISMWISNTATTAMMFPIGVSILTEMARMKSHRDGREIRYTDLRYGTGLMLMTAFAASVGGLATPVGTPPNLIGIGIFERTTGVKIHFFQWMLVAFPLTVAMIAFLVFYLGRRCPAEPGLMKGSGEWIRIERQKLGRFSTAQIHVLIAFALTVTFWVLPGIFTLIQGNESPLAASMNQRLPEAVVSLLGALLLFVLPVRWRGAQGEATLVWRDAKAVDWGTILLFGGGLALGDLMFSTGLARWLGEGVAGAMGADSTFALVVLFTFAAAFVSETSSNTASASMVVPVAISVAQAAGVNPLQPALAACLGASMGFMLPVSTPPNAIVYGSGCVPLRQMIRHGFALDIVGCLMIIATVWWIVPLVLN